MKRPIRSLTSIFLALFTALVVSVSPVFANEYQQEIDRINEEIEAGEAEVESLQYQANTLQGKLTELQGETASLESQIATTQQNITDKENAIAGAEADLVRQREILAENIRVLYRNSNLDSLEILASSNDFSDFIEKQENLESLKTKIQDTIESIEETRKQLEQERKDLEGLQAQQETQRSELYAAQNVQQNLLEQTQGEEARYQDLLGDLEQQRAEAEAALEAYLARLAAQAAAANFGASLGPVAAGEAIGGVGSTGMSSGYHLHFEIREGESLLNPSSMFGSNYQWPVSGGSLTQSYGCVAPYYTYSRKCDNGMSLHAGIDIAAPKNTPVLASAGGELLALGCSADILGFSAYGYMGVIAHADGRLSLYAHMTPPAGSAAEATCGQDNFGFYH